MKTHKKICIVNYGQGNLQSIRNMILRLDANCLISENPEEIQKASHLILPGVGAFDRGMKGIIDRGLRDVLDQAALVRKIPVLGICLGAQIMTERSEEGVLPGLGWFAGDVRRFRFSALESQLPVPNIGWRDVNSVKAGSLIDGIELDFRFYFVHSFHIEARNQEDIALQSKYGFDFVAGMQRGNLYSAQFHPEKSHRFGISFLRSFLNVK